MKSQSDLTDADREAAEYAHRLWVLNDCKTNGREIFEIEGDIWKRAFLAGIQHERQRAARLMEAAIKDANESIETALAR